MEPAVLVPHLLDRELAPPEAARRWRGLQGSLEHVSDGAAFVYRFRRHGGMHYLRLTPPTWRSRDELAAEIAFVAAAREHGVPAPPFVPSETGSLIEEVPSREGIVHATVVAAAPGAPVTAEMMTVGLMYAQGGLIGRLHRASDVLALPPGARRDDWHREFAIVREWLPATEVAAHCALDEEMAFVAALQPEAGAYGMIHYDIGGTNLLVNGDDLWLIDFDDAVFSWYVADLAPPALLLRHEDDPGRRRALLRAMVEGYRSEHPIEDRWLNLLPRFIRQRAIGALAWHCHSGWFDVDDPVRYRASVDRVIAAPDDWL